MRFDIDCFSSSIQIDLLKGDEFKLLLCGVCQEKNDCIVTNRESGRLCCKS